MTQEAGDRQRPDPDIVRAEAERLVATGLAAVSMAADRIGAPTRERGGAAAASFDALGDMLFGPAGHRRHSVANDSPECCRCPVCRVIAAARQPSPTFAERLANGVGALAEGTARVLRGAATLSGAGANRGAEAEATDVASGGASAARPEPGPPAQAAPDPWAAATAEPPAAVAPAAVAVATPASPNKTVKKVAKKTAAKKTAKKAAPRPRKTTGNADQ
jgi:hypothetical protein